MSTSARTLHELVRAGGLLRRISRPYFAAHGISPAQWGIMRALRRQEEARRPPPLLTELGSIVLVKAPSMSGNVARLVRRGFVAKETGRRDARSRRVRLTTRGRRLLDTVLVGHHRWQAGLLAPLSRRDQRRLLDLLVALTAAWKPRADLAESAADHPRRARINRRMAE